MTKLKNTAPTLHYIGSKWIDSERRSDSIDPATP